MGNANLCQDDPRQFGNSPDSFSLNEKDLEVYQKFKKANQEHIFDAWDSLIESERKELLLQCQRFEPQLMNDLFSKLVQGAESDSAAKESLIEPYDGEICIKEQIEETQKKDYLESGYDLIRKAQAGVLILAGGQGSRLGFEHPKGMFTLQDLPSKKSIFHLLVEQYVKAQMDAFACEDIDQFKQLVNTQFNGQMPCKLVFLTSWENRDETVQYFKDCNWFGLQENFCTFIVQSMLPALDLEGKILMESQSKMKLAPNGNGALFDTLRKDSEIREWLQEISYLQIVGVDNVINKLLDPIQIGFTAANNMQASLKTLIKRNESEKVGVIAKKDGKYEIVEYTEIPEDLVNARNNDDLKSLKFGQGSILIFLVSTKLLLQICDPSIESNNQSHHYLYHKALKKVEHCNLQKMERIAPQKENAWKFELFIHNFLEHVEDGKLGVLQVRRETEFAPIKNKDGADSAYTASQLLLDEASELLLEYANFELDLEVTSKIEMSPLVTKELLLKKLPQFQNQLTSPGYINEYGQFRPSLVYE